MLNQYLLKNILSTGKHPFVEFLPSIIKFRLNKFFLKNYFESKHNKKIEELILNYRQKTYNKLTTTDNNLISREGVKIMIIICKN